MQITFQKCGDDVVFTLSKFDSKYEDVFEMCFYEKNGENYIKSFSKKTPNLEKIMVNYKKVYKK